MSQVDARRSLLRRRGRPCSLVELAMLARGSWASSSGCLSGRRFNSVAASAALGRGAVPTETAARPVADRAAEGERDRAGGRAVRGGGRGGTVGRREPAAGVGGGIPRGGDEHAQPARRAAGEGRARPHRRQRPGVAPPAGRLRLLQPVLVDREGRVVPASVQNVNWSGRTGSLMLETTPSPPAPAAGQPAPVAAFGAPERLLMEIPTEVAEFDVRLEFEDVPLR